MKSEEGNETFKNGGYHSRKLGFKWRLYIFSSIYRNVCLNNYPINFFSELINILLIAFPLAQPICHYFWNTDKISSNGDSQSNEDLYSKSIWNTSYILSFISPNGISTETILIGCIILMFFFLFFFLICLMYPIIINKIKYFLTFQIHTICFHFFSSCLGFCIYYLARYLSDDIAMCSFLFIFFYIFYFGFFMFMSYIECNSLIRPNMVLVEWFHGFSTFSPLLVLIYNVVGYNTERITRIAPRIVIYSFQFIISFSVSLLIFFKHPYQNNWMNDISVSKHLTVSIYSVIAIFMIFFHNAIGTWPLSSIPIITFLLYMITHFLNEFRRKSILNILNSIESVDNLTVEAIKLGLSSFKNEGQIQMVIKYGFFSGNKVIVSPSFIHYCIETYPNSNWLMSYIIFLYGTVWGTDSMSYRFFLHMSSVEKLHMVPELLMFQLIYCYMQCSETISPIISRYLEDYRCSLLILAQAHKYFWLNASTTTSLQHFSVIAENYAFNFVRNDYNLQNLEAMFPFSPSVMYEKSIFFADFNNDYLISSKYFAEGSKMASNGIHYIAFKLFSSYKSTMTKLQNNFVDEKRPNEYSFLSLKENHDRAQRKALFFKTNDFYIKRLSNSFSTKPESLPQHVTFFRSETFYIIFTIILMSIVAVVLFFLHFHIQTLFWNEKQYYEYIKEMINETVNFRKSLAICEYDVMLILTVQLRVYENISIEYLREGEETPSLLSDNFFWFVVNHLMKTEEETSKYSILYQDFTSKIGLPKLYAFGKINENNTFQSLFMDYHRIAVLFIQCREISTREFNSDEFMNIVKSLDDIAKQVYKHLSKYLNKYAKSTLRRNSSFFIALPVCDIILAIAFGTILNGMIMNYLWKIFSIVRTIQPPALKVISVQFDRLLKFQEHHIPMVKTNPLYHPILYYTLCLVSFFVLPIIFCVKSSKEKSKLPEYLLNEELPKIPIIDPSINYMYYTFAVIEYLITINSTLIPYYNISIVESVFGPDPLCIHFLFNSLTNVNETKYDFYESIKRTEVVLGWGLTLFFGCLFFFMFLWSSWRYMILLNCIKKIFHFINFRSAQTNPVLSQLYNGQSVSIDIVKEFSKDLQTPPTKINFFLAYFFNENYDIVSQSGFLEKISNSNYFIYNLNSFVNFLNENAVIHKGFDLDEFFTKKLPSKQLFFSLNENSEFSMQFNNPYELFIKDESSNFMINKKRRLIQELTIKSDKLVSLTNLDTELVILLIMDHVTIDNAYQFLSIASEYESRGLVKLDSRNNRLVFLISLANVPQVEAAKLMLSFINDCSFLLPDVKCAVDYGGPLQIINTMKSPMAKSRVIGLAFDILSLFTSSIKIGKFYVTKPFAEILQLENRLQSDENGPLVFKQFKVTDKIVIQAAELHTETIGKILC